MGSTCCAGNPNSEGIIQEQSGLDIAEAKGKVLTHEEFADQLAPGSDSRHAKINLEIIETIMLQPDDEEEDEPVQEAPVKRSAKDRKGTGFVTKKMVEEADKKAPVFDEPEEPPKRLSAAGQRIKGRKGTGFVSKQKLLEALNGASDEEDEDDDTGGRGRTSGTSGGRGAEPPKRVSKIKQRKGTGFVTKEKLKKIVANLGEEDDE